MDERDLWYNALESLGLETAEHERIADALGRALRAIRTLGDETPEAPVLQLITTAIHLNSVTTAALRNVTGQKAERPAGPACPLPALDVAEKLWATLSMDAASVLTLLISYTHSLTLATLASPAAERAPATSADELRH